MYSSNEEQFQTHYCSYSILCEVPKQDLLLIAAIELGVELSPYTLKTICI